LSGAHFILYRTWNGVAESELTQIGLMLLQIVQVVLNIVWWIIVIQAVLSWLIAFNVINTHSDFVRAVWTALQRMTEPLYRPIRRILPDFGALDISPLVVLLILYILQNIVIPRIAIMIAGAAL
jgi:YggT family protein